MGPKRQKHSEAILLGSHFLIQIVDCCSMAALGGIVSSQSGDHIYVKNRLDVFLHGPIVLIWLY